MARERSANLSEGNLARLVDAERDWRVSLDAAKAAAAARLDTERALLRAADEASRAETATAVEGRRRELDAEAARAAAGVVAEFSERIERFAQCDDMVVDRIARVIADRAPWFSTPGGA